MKKPVSNSYLLFFLPAAVLSVTLIVYPLFYGIFISFFETNLINKWDFTGFKNYLALVGDRTFANSLAVNFQYILLVVAGHLVIGVWLALLLNKQVRGRLVFRSVLLLPWLIPEVVYATIWKWIMNPQYGIANHLLVDLGMLESPLSWFGDVNLALGMVSFVSILKGYPFIMIMVLAALQSVPDEEYEAGDIDGCNAVKSFVYITVPHILPVLSVALILDTVAWFKHFTMINIMTGGGPSESTSVLSVAIYQTAFDAFHFGSAAAMAVVVFLICYGFGLLYRRMGDYENR
jgi:multiple sugar transport system permease protein